MSNNKDFVARVIATHGKHSFVEDKTGKIFEAIRRGKKKDVVVGDLVKCKQSSDEQVAIESVEERKSLLYRSDEFRTKPLAANIDQVALVFATRPTYNPRFIWKAILAAETANIPMLIIRNKTDITEDDNQVRPFIDQLKELGCSIVEVSATAYPKETEQKLFPLFEHRITLLIGQSGMGKSTILNLLVKDAEQKTQEYSKALNLGKQTTTSTRWFQFGNDGAIVDSPGFQEFGLAHLTLNDIMRGFLEIKERVEYCRFTNCRHLEEPQCAVKAAVENHDIDPERYALYKELAEETLRPKNY